MRNVESNADRFRTPRALALTLPIVLLALAQSTVAAPPPGKGKPGSGDDSAASCSYPAFADVPKERLERRERRSRYDDFSDPRYGWIRDAIAASTPVTLLENGLPDTATDPTNPNKAYWTHERMIDPLNRSGNAGIDENGNACTNCTPEGKRQSAWYERAEDFANARTHKDVDVLALGGEVAGLSEGPSVQDPTRPGTPWEQIRPGTGWLKTWERGQTSGSWVIEGELDRVGVHKFKAPMYLEASVNFSRMQTPGFRVSLWLMPATFDGNAFEKTDTESDECQMLQDGLLTNGCYSDPTPAFRSEAYDRNWKNGYEMDIFEFEPVDVIDVDDGNGGTERVVCGNAIEFSALNDYVGNRGRDTEYAVKNHFEGFEEGYCDPSIDYGGLSCDKTYANPSQVTDYLINDDEWHTIGFLWTANELFWIFNDEIVLEITDPAKIPHPSVHQYLNLSREITNGLSTATIVSNPDDADPNEGGDAYTTYLPAESGLYGWDGRSNAGDFLDNIASDEAMIRSIEVWDLSESL